MTARRQRPPQRARGVIGPGLVLRGRLEGRGDLDLEGRLEGELELAGDLRVAPGGRAVAVADPDAPGAEEGPLRVRSLSVEGLVVGDVHADAVLVREGGTLRGQVKASRVGLDDGGMLLGTIDMDFELPPELA